MLFRSFFEVVYKVDLSISGEEKAAGFKSRVDYVIYEGEVYEGGKPKAVVELKSPNVFQLTDTALFSTGNSFRVVLRPGVKNVAVKVINKVSVMLFVFI